jgi:hypothetical protein
MSPKYFFDAWMEDVVPSFKYNPNFDFKGISSMSTDEISGGSQKSINFGKKFPLGLILEPSRDLAEQVARDIEIFSKYVNSPEINVQLLVGGDNNKAQKKRLGQIAQMFSFVLLIY